MLSLRRVCLAVAFLVGGLLLAVAAVAAELTVVVQGVNTPQGRVAVALFAQAEGFPKDDSLALARMMVPVDPQAKKASAVFPRLAPGRYAVSVFHDHNDTGKLETNLFGIPLKGYGFSQNVNPSMRAARFTEAQFELPEPGKTIVIDLIYR
ncbi:DUF2141 domain-containing protein [Pollutimonas thiosulfatoxidans]|nr:DUF2141 domain-containing protein [Pollutimonas thiosulfatoxidans]